MKPEDEKKLRELVDDFLLTKPGNGYADARGKIHEHVDSLIDAARAEERERIRRLMPAGCSIQHVERVLFKELGPAPDPRDCLPPAQPEPVQRTDTDEELDELGELRAACFRAVGPRRRSSCLGEAVEKMAADYKKADLELHRLRLENARLLAEAIDEQPFNLAALTRRVEELETWRARVIRNSEYLASFQHAFTQRCLARSEQEAADLRGLIAHRELTQSQKTDPQPDPTPDDGLRYWWDEDGTEHRGDIEQEAVQYVWANAPFAEAIDGSNLLTPDDGYHMLKTSIGRVLLTRVSVASDIGFFRRESFYMYRLGGPEKMRALMKEAMSMRTNGELTPVFVFRSYWRRVAQKKRRSLESVVLASDQKQRIVEDVETFLKRQPWYEARSLPYRRGYLFEGPPGTGKTSLALALAGHVGRALYALNLGSLSGDDALFEAVLSVPQDGILLIEDIDATNATKSREATTDKAGAEIVAAAVAEPKKEERKLTLSGLLNALDGAFTREGRIVIMTTNHPEHLDPALLRPGRADMRERLGLFGMTEALEMAKAFEDGEGLVGLVRLRGGLPIVPAELQGILLKGHDNEGYRSTLKAAE